MTFIYTIHDLIVKYEVNKHLDKRLTKKLWSLTVKNKKKIRKTCEQLKVVLRSYVICDWPTTVCS